MYIQYIHISSLSIHVRSHQQNLPVFQGLNSTSKGRKGGCTETSGFIDHQLGLDVGFSTKPLRPKIVAKQIETVFIRYTANEKRFLENTDGRKAQAGPRWDCLTFCSCGEILCESQCPSHSRSFLNMCLFQHKSTKQKKKSIQNSQVQWIFQIKHSISSNARRHQFEPLPWCLLWDPRTWTFCWCGICMNLLPLGLKPIYIK